MENLIYIERLDKDGMHEGNLMYFVNAGTYSYPEFSSLNTPFLFKSESSELAMRYWSHLINRCRSSNYRWKKISVEDTFIREAITKELFLEKKRYLEYYSDVVIKLEETKLGSGQLLIKYISQ